MAAVVRNRFYPLAAMVLAALMVTGFARSFYLRPWFDLSPMNLLLHLHGLVFSAWFALFVIQTRLIAAHNYRAHMRLGIAGAVLAALVVVFGIVTALGSANAPRVRALGLSSPQFIFIPLFAISVFGTLVASAIALRRRADLHKRLMTLAMIAVLGPPVARLIALTQNRDHFLAIQTSVVAAFVIWCIASDWLKNRRLHPICAVGGSLLVLSWPFRAWFAATPEWGRIGRWIASEMGAAPIS